MAHTGLLWFVVICYVKQSHPPVFFAPVCLNYDVSVPKWTLAGKFVRGGQIK